MGKSITVDNNFKLPCYLAEPTGECKGGLILIHEIWGLADHIKDVADRFAEEGYLVLAPNLFHDTTLEEQLTPDMGAKLFDPKTRNEFQPKLRELTAPINSPEFGKRTIEELQACFNYLFDESSTHQKVAVLGYCFGGTYSFNLASVEPRLKAAIPYYGYFSVADESIKNIKCPILALYGENDERLVEQLPEVKEKMQASGINFTYKVYENCGHAFFNDTNPYAYNKEAAEDAWKSSLEFLSANLS